MPSIMMGCLFCLRPDFESLNFCGLTISDIDFKNNRINVDHQLQRTRDMHYIIEDTKTACGVRMIPMTPEVKECFERIIGNRPKPNVEPMIDGRSGFLFWIKMRCRWWRCIGRNIFSMLWKKYNRIYRAQLPKITPHVCRHTYCSNMAKAGMNPKTLQYLMGHSDIGVTLNTYTHLSLKMHRQKFYLWMRVVVKNHFKRRKTFFGMSE